MVAQVWNDQLRDEAAVSLSRLASEPMEATEPGTQIIGEQDSARLDQGAVVGGVDQLGKLALGVSPRTSDGDKSRDPLAGDRITAGIELQPI
jgi:hypothetical protein